MKNYTQSRGSEINMKYLQALLGLMPNLTYEVSVFYYAEQHVPTDICLSLIINTRHYPKREYYTIS